jgi:arabinogalactan oligomer/maltooligosaccharide transport system permease protein
MRTRWLESAATHLMLLIVVAVVLFPVFFIFTASIRKTFIPPTLLPDSVTTDNFLRLFREQGFVLWAVNTAIVCLGTIILTFAMITPAAYAFSFMRFAGHKQLMVFMLFAQLFPSLVGMVAIYRIMSAIGMVNLGGMILIYAGSSVPFYTWFLKGYMDTMPKSLVEAALMDGAGHFKIFRDIVLPLAKPALGVIAFMAFLVPYNDFILPSFMLEYPDTTLVYGLATLAGIGGRAPDYPMLAAGVLLASIPLLAVFLVFQRYLIMGLTRGAVR